MATVTEVSGNGGGAVGAGPEDKGPETAALAINLESDQVKAYTGTAGVVDNEIGNVMVRVLTTTDAFIAIGNAPTATTADTLMVANSPEVFRCKTTDKVSAIQLSTGGNVHVTGVN